MKYTVYYEFYGTKYKSNFDCRLNAELFIKSLPAEWLAAELLENVIGKFDPETGYFNGEVKLISTRYE